MTGKYTQRRRNGVLPETCREGCGGSYRVLQALEKKGKRGWGPRKRLRSLGGASLLARYMEKPETVGGGRRQKSPHQRGLGRTSGNLLREDEKSSGRDLTNSRETCWRSRMRTFKREKKISDVKPP